MNNKKTLQLVETAVLIAITIIMGTTPLGTIPTPFLKISLVTVPVAIAAIVIGPVAGLICGTAFGLTSLFGAVTGTSGMLSVLFTINPVGVVITALVPRMLEGLLVGLIFKLLHGGLKLKKVSYYLSALCCPALNTLMFMSCIVGFFYNTDYVQNTLNAKEAGSALSFVIALVGFQCTIECITCLILGGLVSFTLAKILHKAD